MKRDGRPELWMNARAVQALTEVFPENFPVALNRPGKRVSYDQIGKAPIFQAIQRLIKVRRERWRIVRQRNKNEPVPLSHGNLIERKIAPVEAFGLK